MLVIPMGVRSPTPAVREQAVAVDDRGCEVNELAVSAPRLLTHQFERAVLVDRVTLHQDAFGALDQRAPPSVQLASRVLMRCSGGGRDEAAGDRAPDTHPGRASRTETAGPGPRRTTRTSSTRAGRSRLAAHGIRALHAHAEWDGGPQPGISRLPTKDQDLREGARCRRASPMRCCDEASGAPGASRLRLAAGRPDQRPRR